MVSLYTRILYLQNTAGILCLDFFMNLFIAQCPDSELSNIIITPEDRKMNHTSDKQVTQVNEKMFVHVLKEL